MLNAWIALLPTTIAWQSKFKKVVKIYILLLVTTCQFKCHETQQHSKAYCICYAVQRASSAINCSPKPLTVYISCFRLLSLEISLLLRQCVIVHCDITTNHLN